MVELKYILLGAMLKLVIRHLNPNHMVELKYILKICKINALGIAKIDKKEQSNLIKLQNDIC